jgi:hypothetical protein
MSIEANVDHWSIQGKKIDDKVGKCDGVIIKFDEVKLSAVVKVEPTLERCYRCPLRKYCDESEVETD